MAERRCRQWLWGPREDHDDSVSSDRDRERGAAPSSEAVRRAQRALRQARRDLSHPWRTWPERTLKAAAAILVRAVRAVGELLREVFGELILALIALGLVAGGLAAVRWAWHHSAVATVAVGSAIAAVVAFWARKISKSGEKRGWQRFAVFGIGVAAVLFYGLWLYPWS